MSSSRSNDAVARDIEIAFPAPAAPGKPAPRRAHLSKAPGAGNMPMRLTVVVPHYNHIDVLPRALASALAQDIDDCEIIVIDDGSEPQCQPTLDRLAAAAPTVRVIRHASNAGAPAALNTGLAAARGRHIAFLGADDVALPGLYRSMSDALDRYPNAAFASGEVAIAGMDGSLRGIRPMTPPALVSGYLSPELVRQRIRHTDNWVCNTTVVYQTDRLRRLGGFEERLGAFCDGVAVRLLAFEHGFVFVPGIAGIWSVSPQTLSARSVLDPSGREALAAAVVERLRSSIVGKAAPEYPDMFARRLRFSTARLHLVWGNATTDPGTVCTAAGLPQLDRRMLSAIKAATGFGRAGRVTAIGWLALRLTPFNPWLLALHAARNTLLTIRHRRQIGAVLAEMKARGRRLTSGREAA